MNTERGAPAGRLIDGFIPRPDISRTHEVLIHAPADIVFDAAREQNLASHPIIRGIFRLREILLRAKPTAERPRRGLVADTLALGWGVLAERPGREIVIGAVTQPWLPNVTFRTIPPDRFVAFNGPDLVKIAWTLEAEPLGLNRTRYRTETRVLATDAPAKVKFRRYWSRVGLGVELIRILMLPMVRREAERRARRVPEGSPRWQTR